MLKDSQDTREAHFKTVYWQQQVLGLFHAVVKLAATEGADQAILRTEAKNALSMMADFRALDSAGVLPKVRI
jgi:hypothetical protein